MSDHTPEPPRYAVMVDDNFHFMDEDERYCAGEYATYAEALAVAKGIVESCMDASDGRTAEEIAEAYEGFGEDPFIVARGGAPWPEPQFSAWEYAREYAARLAAEREEGGR